MNMKEKITKISKLDFVLITIPSIALVSLLIFIYWNKITMEAFWSNLTYFLLGGIFFPLATLITLRIKHHYNEEKQYNSKKLNEEVFKKLICVTGIDYFPYFQNKFGFCISINEDSLSHNPYTSYLYPTLERNIDRKTFEKEFESIDKAIPSLEVGENYLKKNYNDVYLQWMKIKQELDNINKDRQEFYRSVSDKIIKELKKHFKTNPTIRLNPHGNGWAYFQDVVLLMLPLLFAERSIEFEIDHDVDNQYYLVYGGFKFVGFNKIENYNSDMAQITFNDVISNYDIENKNSDFHFRLVKLNDTIENFRKDLQKKVVNDIDNFM